MKPYYKIDYDKLEEVTESTNESGEAYQSDIPRLPIDKTLIFESRFEIDFFAVILRSVWCMVFIQFESITIK